MSGCVFIKFENGLSYLHLPESPQACVQAGESQEGRSPPPSWEDKFHFPEPGTRGGGGESHVLLVSYMLGML